jgi:hypothetical protein
MSPKHPLDRAQGDVILAGQQAPGHTLAEAGYELRCIDRWQRPEAVVVGLAHELPAHGYLVPAAAAAELRPAPNRLDVSGRKQLVCADQELWVRKLSNQGRSLKRDPRDRRAREDPDARLGN